MACTRGRRGIVRFAGRRGWPRWLRVVAACAVAAAGLGLLPPGLPVPGSGAQPAWASDPVPPPAPVNPAPRVVEVTAPGPTQVSGALTADTVWSPQGSPYLVTGQLNIPAGVELTLLPGTVVKIAQQQAIFVNGSLLVLGDPGNHVVITSLRDDSVMGDSNGDGAATSPAPGDWNEISVQYSGTAVFDYADLRYGGQGSACYAYGEVESQDHSALVVADSTFTQSQNAGIVTGSGGTNSAGIYNSSFATSCMGVSATQPGHLDVTGNTFDLAGKTALFLLYPQHTRAWFNTISGLTTAAGASPTTRAMADIRFNQLGGVAQYGAGNQQLTDWSDNWWGHDANDALPACMDPGVAANSVPAVTVSGSSSGCPSGQRQVTGYTQPVLPALTASPLVLPASLREASAPRFGPVDTYSGALTYRVDDMQVQDAGKTITASRTYRSDRLTGGDAGSGWRTAFDEAMSSAAGTSTMKLPDGTSLDFTTDPAAGYTPAPGVAADFSTGAGGTTVTSPDRVSYQFDPGGVLTGMDLGDQGHHLTIDHSGGQVSKVTGVSGRYVAYGYAGGNLTSETDQSSREVDFGYDGSRLTSVTGADGHAETYDYDADGHLTKVTAPDGLVKLAAGYGSDGRVAWIEQAGAGRTTFSYDDADGKRIVTLADGTVITQRYDWAGRLVSERLGKTGTHVVYDGDGRVTASITGVPGAAMSGYGPPASLTLYDGHGDPYLKVDPMGNATSTTFNSKHEPLLTTRPDGSTISRSYDDQGRMTELDDPRGKPWLYTYNSFGELRTRTDPLSRDITIGYAGNGDVTSLTDQTHAITQYGYDPQGRRTSVTTPLGHETDTEYTPWDAVKKVTTPNGGITRTDYDTDRRITQVTDPLGGITGHDYGTQGRLHSTTDPAGGVTVTGYDLEGRQVQVTDPRGSASARTYTPEGWVDTSTDPDGKITRYAYDPSGRPVRVTDPTGTVTQTVYDRNGSVTEIDRPDGSAWTWSYDSTGRQVQATLPRGGLQKTTYDPAGNVTSVLGPRAAGSYPGATLYGTTYTYDDAGRLHTSTDAAGTTTSYAYDDTARTVTATDPLGTAGITGYDTDGNVTSRTNGDGKVTSYGYGADGNLTMVTDPTGRQTSYTYNLGDQMTSSTDPGGHATTYDHDAGGMLRVADDERDGVGQRRWG